MKKFLLFPIFLFALETPPAIPILKANTKKTNSCDIIPPMLLNLPPMLEDDLDKCKNEKYKPSKKFSKKRIEKLLKSKVEVYKVEIMKDFSMLYKITTNKGVFLCNRKITKCLISTFKEIK